MPAWVPCNRAIRGRQHCSGACGKCSWQQLDVSASVSLAARKAHRSISCISLVCMHDICIFDLRLDAKKKKLFMIVCAISVVKASKLVPSKGVIRCRSDALKYMIFSRGFDKTAGTWRLKDFVFATLFRCATELYRSSMCESTEKRITAVEMFCSWPSGFLMLPIILAQSSSKLCSLSSSRMRSQSWQFVTVIAASDAAPNSIWASCQVGWAMERI